MSSRRRMAKRAREALGLTPVPIGRRMYYDPERSMWFRRSDYQAGGTTWRCTRCNTLAWEEFGRLGGCECPAELGASPLSPTNPDFRFHDAVSAQPQEHDRCSTEIEDSARHLLETMSLIGADGKPLFAISDVHDEASAGLLRHAVINLQATLDGSPLPTLALPKEAH